MDKVSFGQILRETRERKGLELNATARRLRIRPDILKAIEDGNFAAMPPRGYTRNMVNGYARYLGLNPTEITGMYLDELYSYQVDYASSRKRSSGIEMPDANESSFSMRRAGERSTLSFSRESSATRGRSSRRSRQSDETRRTSNRTHQARGSVLPNSDYTNFYSGPNAGGGSHSKLPYIIAIAIAVLLLALLGWFLFGRGGGNKADDSVPNVPVTGVSSETGSSSSTTTPAPQPPTKFTFEYSVDNGATSWIEVSVDGEQRVAEEVTGPATQSFESSGVLQFVCANPAGVTARQDGTELLLQPDDSGIVNITIDFNEVLAKWRADNNVGTSASTTGNANAAAGAAAAGAAAAGAAGAAVADQTATQDAATGQGQQAQATDQGATENVGAYDEGSANAGADTGYVEPVYTDQTYTDQTYTDQTYNQGYTDQGYVDYGYNNGYGDQTYYDQGNAGTQQTYDNTYGGTGYDAGAGTGYYDEYGVWHQG